MANGGAYRIIVKVNMIVIKSKGILTCWTYFYDDLLTRLLEQ